MKEQLVSYTTARLAEEKGFDWICIDTYYEGELRDRYKPVDLESVFDQQTTLQEEFEVSKHTIVTDLIVAAPTQSLLQKWLRDVHNMTICVLRQPGHWEIIISQIDPYGCLFDPNFRFDTYEQALEYGLKEALNLIK